MDFNFRFQLLDVKYATQYGRPPLPDRNNRVIYSAYPGCSSNQNTSCSSTDSMRSKDSREQFNPVYEEVSAGSSRRHKRGVSVDSDIDDTDVEPDSVVSEDEFAEDELSLADFPKDSPPAEAEDLATKSYRPGTLPNEGFSRKRGKNSSRSIDRNIDKYPSDTLRAKHNYYVSKDKMAGDLYGSNRRQSSHQYPSKNCNSHPRSSRGNYNRNSSGSGGSAVNSHSTGTPPYNDPRVTAQCPISGPLPYYTAGPKNARIGSGGGGVDPMDHRQMSLPHHQQHFRVPPNNRMAAHDGGVYNHKIHPGHRPNYGYNSRGNKQQTPTDHTPPADLTSTAFQPPGGRKTTPVGPQNNHFPLAMDTGAPFTIDAVAANPSPVASHLSDKVYGKEPTVSSSDAATVNNPSGQKANSVVIPNKDVHQEDEPIYNELDPVYAQRPLYT